MQSPYLLAALGNPGPRYANTRHNAGFILADAFVRYHHLAWEKNEADALVCILARHGVGLLVVKPQTFMNLSGLPLARLAQQYTIPLEQIIVVHDDLDLPLGRTKISWGRGAGGHRGILSVIETLGSRDFGRMRVGIGRPPEYMPPAEYVLSNFSDAEWGVICDCLPRFEQSIDLFILKGITKAMNVINSSAGGCLKNFGTVV